MTWKTLGAVAPTDLVEARNQLHHAAQVVASAGISFLASTPDDSHPNFGWQESLGTLLGRFIPSANAHFGLRVADLSLLRVAESGKVLEAFALDGQGLDDAYAWLAEASSRGGAELSSSGLVRAAYEIPMHAVANGTNFSFSSKEAFSELARWFANGDSVLTEMTTRMPNRSDVRCWPHHFDLGSLAIVAREPDGRLAKSIGLGLSPGDAGYAEPYWYVSPWPYPDPTTLPDLARGGHWHTEGYTSAVLTASDLLRDSSGSQSDRLEAFLGSAVEVCRRMLAD